MSAPERSLPTPSTPRHLPLAIYTSPGIRCRVSCISAPYASPPPDGRASDVGSPVSACITRKDARLLGPPCAVTRHPSTFLKHRRRDGAQEAASGAARRAGAAFAAGADRRMLASDATGTLGTGVKDPTGAAASRIRRTYGRLMCRRRASPARSRRQRLIFMRGAYRIASFGRIGSDRSGRCDSRRRR